MGQRTAYILQRIYHIRDNKNESREQNGGYVIGATLGFYCQDGYGVYLLRDVNSLLQRMRVKEGLLKMDKYYHNDMMVKGEYYRIRDYDFTDAPKTRKIITKTDRGRDIKRDISVDEIKERLMRFYNSYDEFRAAVDPGASYPFMEKLDIWVSERIEDIDTDNLFKYIPMKDFRDEKLCKEYFGYFDNNDGGALITLYGGTDYCSDIREVRIIDGRDRYGQFVDPDYYIKQYIKWATGRSKSYGNWMKKNWKNFVKLIEDFHEAKIIKEF